MIESPIEKALLFRKHKKLLSEPLKSHLHTNTEQRQVKQTTFSV